MKTFVHILIAIATLLLGSVASADEKPLVITGRVVALSDQNINVQSGRKRLELVISNDTKYTVKPKVGDTVKVYYTNPAHSRFDPDGDATKIEVIAAGGSKK